MLRALLALRFSLAIFFQKIALLYCAQNAHALTQSSEVETSCGCVKDRSTAEGIP